jgi:hypothetical protein
MGLSTQGTLWHSVLAPTNWSGLFYEQRPQQGYSGSPGEGRNRPDEAGRAHHSEVYRASD